MCVSAYTPWPVGEMVNTLPSQGNIHGFEPHTGHQIKKIGHESVLSLFMCL